MSENGEPLFSDKEKAARLNSFFGSVFTNDDGTMPDWKIECNDESLAQVVFEPYVVYHKLKQLPSKLSSGPDNFPSLLFKKLALSLAEPLAKIFSKSFECGKLPDEWLAANI